MMNHEKILLRNTLVWFSDCNNVLQRAQGAEPNSKFKWKKTKQMLIFWLIVSNT